MCVCVAPCFQGFLLNLHPTTAGGSRVCSWREPTKLQVQTRISKEDALSTYLQPELLTTLSNLLRLIPWLFMLPPLNRFSTAAFSRLYRAASRASETMFNISSDRTHSPFRSLTFLPNVAIESNWKPMSECEPLSLPTWVLGVTLRKEALKPFRLSVCPIYHWIYWFSSRRAINDGIPHLSAPFCNWDVWRLRIHMCMCC